MTASSPAATTATPRRTAISYVRWSTSDQSSGDSERRQLAASRAYADAHGLHLDEALRFADKGVSAFRGRNLHEGALGALVDAIDAGRIAPGSVLLVESLDRLSRDKVLTALNRLTDILQRGVDVVTLHDGHVFTHAKLNTDVSSLMMAVLGMARAWEESSVKGKRVAAAWSNLRTKAQESGHVLTGKGPSWLVARHDRTGFDPVPERVEVVRKVFAWALEGIGATAATRRLNVDGTPPFGYSGRWSTVSVKKLLRDRSVIGEYQPHRQHIDPTTGAKTRKPDGPAISNYFPVVVEPDVFLRVQEGRRKQLNGRGGRRGTAFSNLFTTMCHCGACGATMRFVQKGSQGTYLVCSDALYGRTCAYVSWRYPALEVFTLTALRDIDHGDLLPKVATEAANALASADATLRKLTAETTILSQQVDALVSLLVERPESPALLTRLDMLERDKLTRQSELEAAEARAVELRGAVEHASSDHASTVKEIGAWLRDGASAGADEAYARRAKMHALLKRTVERVTVTPTPDDEHLRGWVDVTFQRAPGYVRRIEVDKAQHMAVAYRAHREEDGEGLMIETDGVVIALSDTMRRRRAPQRGTKAKK